MWATLLQLLDWRALLDIFVIGLGLFFVYRNLEAMGAFKIVVGILLGIGLFAAARMLGLAGIDWILSHFSGVALIALIVLFQPEIRRIFERAGTFRRSGGAAGRPELPGVLADVLFELARRGWGAIIVLPGRDSIRAVTSPGIELGAVPSFPLLVSLFDPDSPGHDGAVVIEDGVVSSFGVRLPLSSTGSLSEELGTRHHASRGLAESTDALVIAVSEERRVVTAFRGTSLDVVEDAGRLAKTIDAHLKAVGAPLSAYPGSRSPRGAAAQLALSFVVASVFWLAIGATQHEIRQLDVRIPVELVNVGQNLAVAGPRAQEIDARLSGTSLDLNKLDTTRLRLRVDLSGAAPGRLVVPVDPDDLGLPRGVSVARLDPPSVELLLEPFEEIDVPVTAQVVGAPPQGFRIASIAVRPEAVRVRVASPQGREAAHELMTSPIYASSLTGRTRIVSKLVVPAGAEPVDGSWPDVSVTIDVVKAP